MKNFNLEKIVRENIRNMKPYASARSEFDGKANVFLDANENSFGSATIELYNRYPDPLQKKLRQKIAVIKKVKDSQLFLGNGSDEPIDLLIRASCDPGVHNIIIMPPTYGMYEVAAAINNVEIKKVDLTTAFEIDTEKVLTAVDEKTRIIFICSPNNPTGNVMNQNAIKEILNNFNGLVVVDEAYIDFALDKTIVGELSAYPNLVVLQTFSKAWGLAALRLGLCVASEEIIDLLNKIKSPYNINTATACLVSEALDDDSFIKKTVSNIISERKNLALKLSQLEQVEKVFESDANFLLVKMNQAEELYRYLMECGIIVRNRSHEKHCEGCLRITIGTKEENEKLINTIKEFKK